MFYSGNKIIYMEVLGNSQNTEVFEDKIEAKKIKQYSRNSHPEKNIIYSSLKFLTHRLYILFGLWMINQLLETITSGTLHGQSWGERGGYDAW